MKVPLKNVIAVLTGDLGSRAIGFAVTVYLARILIPASFGLINIGLAVLGYLMLVNSPGIQILETRNAAAAEGGMLPRAGAILSLRLVLSPFLLVLTWAIVTTSGVALETRDVILLYGLSLVPMGLSLDWLFQGKEDFRQLTISRLLNALVFAAGAVIMVRTDADVRLAAIAFLAGNVAATIYLGDLYRRRYGLPTMKWDPTAWRGILRDNVPVGAAMLLAQSVTNLPPLVIGIVLTNTDVGMYSAAMKLTFVILILDRTLNALFLPVATRYAVSRTEEFPRLLEVAAKTVALVVVPVLLAACIVADPIVHLVFGPGYGAAIPLFRILTAYAGLTLLNSLFVCTLVAFGRTKLYATVMAAGAIVIFALVIGLTPFLGAPGAAWGVIIGELIILVLLIRVTSGVTRIPARTEFVKPLTAGLAMAGTAWVTIEMHVLVSLLLSLASFVVVLTVSGGIPKEEFRYLKERFV